MSVPSKTAKVVVDPEFGFRHLDPVPGQGELDAFYSGRYMELVEAGGRAPELRRLLQGGEERKAELDWLRSTLYADVDDALARGLGNRRGVLLDVGCGTGDFLGYAGEKGWRAEGVEPSRLACERARSLGLQVSNESFAAFASGSDRQERYEALVLLNVLEHVPDPVRWVEDCHALLAPGEGLLAVAVPNDFSALQAAAAQALHLAPWWIAAPDHINYFDYASLERLLEKKGFRIVERAGTFPMELFLLMGDDYVTHPELGPECHARRRRLEKALPAEQRRSWYRNLAEQGMGRNCVVVARKL
jgi:2-polyprenyl-3-methyl-5-hydroxy-6-metoxy-1,4-benzoquinol methylase